jgi:hypothetical protein
LATELLNGFAGFDDISNSVNHAALCITSRKVGVAHFSVRSIINSYRFILA